MKYIIDSYAWIEYFDGTKKGEKIREIILNNNEIYTLNLVVAEIMSRAKRTGKNIEGIYMAIITNSIMINPDLEISKNVGLLHAEVKKRIKDFGLIDAFILLTARKLGAKVVTGDEHFRGFKEAILV